MKINIIMVIEKTLFLLIAVSIILLTGVSGTLAGRECHAAEPTSPRININIYDSVMLSGQKKVVVCERGEIYLSEDAGVSWRNAASPTKHNLFSVSFVGEQNGWACGALGTILHTSDGGRTWAAQNSGTEKHLFAIDFYDTDNGCAVGDWGTILRTTDGGITWEDATLSEDIILYGICLTQPHEGWAVGEFGQIFQTRDTGKTWQQFQSPAFQSLFTICGEGESLYAAGLDGAIIYSHDNGDTWEEGSNLSGKSIYGIDVAGQVGWAVGDEGTVLRTENGGQNWKSVDVPMQARLFWFGAISIKANSAPIGFGAGAHGAMFRIQDNTLMWD